MARLTKKRKNEWKQIVGDYIMKRDKFKNKTVIRILDNWLEYWLYGES